MVACSEAAATTFAECEAAATTVAGVEAAATTIESVPWWKTTSSSGAVPWQGGAKRLNRPMRFDAGTVARALGGGQRADTEQGAGQRARPGRSSYSRQCTDMASIVLEYQKRSVAGLMRAADKSRKNGLPASVVADDTLAAEARCPLFIIGQPAANESKVPAQMHSAAAKSNSWESGNVQS